jgi:hypothetical protein
LIYHPEDPNKNIPLSELIKKHGAEFKSVVEKKQWFDEKAKPRKKIVPESSFEPDPNIEEENGKV